MRLCKIFSHKSFLIWDKYVCVNVHVHTSTNVQVQVQMYIFVTFHTLTFHTLTNTHTDSEKTHFKLGALTRSNTNDIACRLIACCDEYVSHLSNMMRVRKISWHKSSRVVVVCQKNFNLRSAGSYCSKEKRNGTGHISVMRRTEKSFWVSFTLMERP